MSEAAAQPGAHARVSDPYRTGHHRGGRYEAGGPAAPEPATGFTLYTDTILRTLPPLPPRRRVLLPLGADRGRARALRSEGWVTVAALLPAADWSQEARRLECDHVLEGDEPRAVKAAAPPAGSGSGRR